MVQSIEISEMVNTWGCIWTLDGKTQYSFENAPLSRSSILWLEMAGGYAVSKILEVGLGQIVSSRPGAYGGEKRTVSVDVDQLNAVCEAYWNRANSRVSPAPTVCHYCGMPASETGFFGESVCSNCQ